jgi:hypothetical protein
MMDDVCHVSPAKTKLGRGHFGGSLGKGLGVLLQGVMALFLVRMHLVTMTEIVSLLTAILVDCDIFFTPGSARLAITTSQLHGLVLPPCNCDARIACNM